MSYRVPLGFILEDDAVLQMAGCSFDMHLMEVYGTLMHGARVVLLHDRGNLDMSYLLDTIARERVTSVDLVPTVMSALWIAWTRSHVGRRCSHRRWSTST